MDITSVLDWLAYDDVRSYQLVSRLYWRLIHTRYGYWWKRLSTEYQWLVEKKDPVITSDAQRLYHVATRFTSIEALYTLCVYPCAVELASHLNLNTIVTNDIVEGVGWRLLTEHRVVAFGRLLSIAPGSIIIEPADFLITIEDSVGFEAGYLILSKLWKDKSHFDAVLLNRVIRLRNGNLTPSQAELFIRLGIVEPVALFYGRRGSVEQPLPVVEKIVSLMTDPRDLSHILKISINSNDLEDTAVAILQSQHVNTKLDRNYALLESVRRKQHKVLAAVIAHPSTNIHAEGEKALQLAINREDTLAVKMLVDAGADLKKLPLDKQRQARRLLAS